MLEKLAKNDNIKKLCIIMLFKVDFNHNNKWLGRTTMKAVEQQNLLAPEQYGSWKLKVASTQCLNKCLFMTSISSPAHQQLCAQMTPKVVTTG